MSRELCYMDWSGEPGVSPVPRSLEHHQDPDRNLPGLPGPFDSKGDPEWPKPHVGHLRVDSEAVATAGEAECRRSRPWVDAAASALNGADVNQPMVNDQSPTEDTAATPAAPGNNPH